jgi:hypothetical protein
MDKELIANPAICPPGDVAARLEPLFERGASLERDARRSSVAALREKLAAQKKH